jgi:dsRNA-specific ribonuclease
MCSKTISDCVEALIGAYFVGGGLDAAFAFLKWLGKLHIPNFTSVAHLHFFFWKKGIEPFITEIVNLQTKDPNRYPIKAH